MLDLPGTELGEANTSVPELLGPPCQGTGRLLGTLGQARRGGVR